MTGLVYHGPEGEPYYVTDSAYGIARAGRSGSKGIDLNARTCRANSWRLWRRKRRIVVVHWSKWWQHGFRPKPGTRVPRKPIERLKLRQVKNLVSVHGGHHILTAEQAASLCKVHNVIPFFEMKPSKWNADVLRNLRTFCRARKIKFAVMTIQAYGKTKRAKTRWEKKAYERMALANRIGVPTMLLYRRPLARPKWAEVLVAVKGHPAFMSVLDLPHFIHYLEKKP